MTKHVTEKKIIVSAPGKIHLSGEHSVVYGKPALLAAIDKRVTATYSPQKSKHKTQDKILDKKYNQINLGYLPNIAITETYKYLQKEPLFTNSQPTMNPEGPNRPKINFNLEINSELIPGCGMGSSAAVSAAIVGAIFCLEKQPWNLKAINNIVYETEKIMHSNPSGADNTIITHGGLLNFQKKENIRAIKNISSKKSLPNFILINSGQPAEQTSEMVKKVAMSYKAQKTKYQKLFDQMGKITEKIISLFEQDYAKLYKLSKGPKEPNRSSNNSHPICLENFGSLITENQRLLEKIGVVSKKAKNIIKIIEKFGGYAKISGAGGVRDGSGIILAFHPDIKKLEYYLSQNKINFFKAALSQEGLKREERSSNFKAALSQEESLPKTQNILNKTLRSLCEQT